MFSSLTERGAAATLDALAMGATDYFTKPSGTHGVDGSLAVIREQLIPEIKALHAAAGRDVREVKKAVRGLSAAPAHAAAGPAPRHVDVVAVGASTGGPNALAEVFSRLPKNLGVPVVVVQHMPPMFTRLMAERMSAQFGLTVKEGVSGAVLQPGQVWIAPGDFHMIVVKNGPHARLLLHQDAPQNSCRPAVDVLFRSVAQTFGTGALAVILTGMGQDGLRGCEAIHEAGGQVLAQDEATSVVWGMPGNVVRAGLADQVLPISHVADEIQRRVK
jgi:two-component system chemotaxis response regulator CheB